MTTAQASSQAPMALPTSSKALCAVYGAIAIAALIATWSQNAAYFDNPGGFLLDFLNDSKVTHASRSLTVDIVLFFLAAAILMVIEARKHGVRFVWAYIVGGLAIAISVTFPLFLIPGSCGSAGLKQHGWAPSTRSSSPCSRSGRRS